MPASDPSEPARKKARQTWLGHVRDQTQFNSELSAILRDASKEAERIVLTLIGDDVSTVARRAQYQATIAQLDQLMIELWDGRVTPAMRRNLVRSSDRALAGLADLDAILGGAIEDATLRANFLRASSNAAENIASRLLNEIDLSDRVYKTRTIANGWVQKEVNRGIALNRSAKEIARSVRRFIRPDVPGGVSYAAQRLGRTELNNAFHNTTIRAAQEMPWVTGFLWNTSGSHPEPDECDDFANDDHDGLGAGVFKKRSVPQKPHPQCLCYVTTIQVDDELFLDRLAAGRYDKFITANTSI